jgi:hypothetical protein
MSGYPATRRVRMPRSRCTVEPAAAMRWIVFAYCILYLLVLVVCHCKHATFETIHIVSLVAALNAAIPLQFSHRPQRLAVFIQRSFHKHILNSTIFPTCRLSEIAGPRTTLLYHAFTNRSHTVRVRSVWSTTHPPQPSGRTTT